MLLEIYFIRKDCFLHLSILAFEVHAISDIKTFNMKGDRTQIIVQAAVVVIIVSVLMVSTNNLV
jgi:hypothetical protein